MTEPTDDTLRDWLLGKLAPGDAEALEQRLIEDEAFATRLRGVENDVLDDLAHGTLAGDERARAAAYFAETPGDRARLRIARALAAVGAEAHAATAPRGRGHAAPAHAMRPRRRWTTAALALGGVAAIALIGLRLSPSFGPTPVAFTITLTDGQQRGASSIEIAVPGGARELRVQAEVDGGEPGTRYTLSIDDTFAARGLPVRTTGPYRFVEASVPAGELMAGSHRVRVVAESGTPSESSWTLTTTQTR